ncbi:MAG: RHS repeat-associated core domain-containing protein, partial [Fusobacteriota bacterium]
MHLGNLRKSKEVNEEETKLYYANGNIINDISGGVTARNLFGIQRKAGGATYQYVKNSHGDVEQVLGSGEQNYEYDDYGKILKGAGSSNPFRYSGEYTDDESGMQYLRARYYNPSIRRFTTEDTYKGDPSDPLSLNYYAYVKGNPLKYVDSSGHYEVMVNLESGYISPAQNIETGEIRNKVIREEYTINFKSLE